MSVDLSRTASNETSSSSLSQLINHDYPDSDGDSSSAPYVVSKHRSNALAGPSTSATHHHRRASSVVSLSSSSLTDPDDLEIVTSSFADTSARAKGNASNTSLAPSTEPESEEEEEDDEDDGLIEVNQDGTEKPLARIKKLLNNPPNEPKHSWETAVSPMRCFVSRQTTFLTAYYIPKPVNLPTTYRPSCTTDYREIVRLCIHRTFHEHTERFSLCTSNDLRIRIGAGGRRRTYNAR